MSQEYDFLTKEIRTLIKIRTIINTEANSLFAKIYQPNGIYENFLLNEAFHPLSKRNFIKKLEYKIRGLNKIESSLRLEMVSINQQLYDISRKRIKILKEIHTEK